MYELNIIITISIGDCACGGRTDGVHQPAVDVSVEQVRHGEHSAVPQGAQVRAAALAARLVALLLRLLLRAVVQKVHEQREVPAQPTHDLQQQITAQCLRHKMAFS